ncbi:terpenoid synthase [Pseudovirgaria hyperparasitica]|uniref:Penichrysol n=1 Tax=Pseudovirgaria hyperparasitica TaxID=470096 RepID=A0A6A6W5M9_9PEZI|nr:terpenoid synthase [Pseudovirgaria hyperparasitica]KAF2756361.1 terpenoid synthase [Pseudovirgaria hyperparasitica]QXF69100.1 penichrysol [Pseudovirgaria hyperparasitica]
MEYRYSYMIDPESYDNQGLCVGIPVRVSRYSYLDDAATVRLRNDWRKYVGPLPATSLGGNMGPLYNFTSAAIPECRPERLGIVAYIMEFGFLHDDVIDVAKISKAIELNAQVMDALDWSPEIGEVSVDLNGERKILANIFKELSAIDPVRAKNVIDYWKKDLDLKRDPSHFPSLDDYLNYRVVDSGSYFLIAIATFGMAITIPPEEMDLCVQLTRPVWLAAVLTNDIQSWEKEQKLAKMLNKSSMTNSLWILMTQESMSLGDAQCRILQMVKQFVATYVDTIKDVKANEQLSLDSRVFIEAMGYMISGNLMWGNSCPRYHPEQKLNTLQLSQLMLTEGSLDHNVPTPPSSNASIAPEKEMCDTIDATIVSTTRLPELPGTVLSAPAEYVASLPSKNIRELIGNAINVWLDVAPDDMSWINQAVGMLHNASLMLDDVQDDSSLRRGKPSTHMVFGAPQTINSASYYILEAMSIIRKHDDTQGLDIFSEEIRNLFIGQSYDLYWSSNGIRPTLQQFLVMIDGKTGGLFRLLARLMMAKARLPLVPNLIPLMTLFGRYFQIRDDYANLNLPEYMEQKGFCEDLDGGKLSIALIYAFTHSESHLLENIISQRHNTGKLSEAQKRLILQYLQESGSVEYTITMLSKLGMQILAEVAGIEKHCEIENKAIQSLLELLKV